MKERDSLGEFPKERREVSPEQKTVGRSGRCGPGASRMRRWWQSTLGGCERSLRRLYRGCRAAPCSPSGTTLQITAQHTKFDKDCLAAPANQDFTIELNNKDAGTSHDIWIQQGIKTVLAGDAVTGPATTTYKVKALSAGTYVFVCSIHPMVMKGTFVVA